MYLEKQCRRALEVYEKIKSMARTITLLGYLVLYRTLNVAKVQRFVPSGYECHSRWPDLSVQCHERDAHLTM